MTPDIVVFDIGGVLIDWQPHLAWADEMDAIHFTGPDALRKDLSARSLL